jgi:uncharacterized protein (TIGR02611 family)
VQFGFPKDLSSFVARLGERRSRHRQRGVLFRLLFAVAGAGVLLAGIVMLVLPGPGLLVTGVGLAMLALEFAWAEHLLSRVAARVQALRLRASRSRGG